jgi:hypothetical protein
MAKRIFAITTALTALLALPAIGHAQTPAPSKAVATPAAPTGAGQSGTLTVAGYPGQVPIFQFHDKSYVELEQLARLTKGSLTFKANQIILTLSSLSAQPVEEAKPKPGFSKEFLRASIEQMGVIREWRSGLTNAIQNSYPLGQEWVSAQRRNADKSLALAAAAISTEDDRNAFPLLSGELNVAQRLSDNYLAMHKDAHYISPDAWDNDSLHQQIVSCSRGLAAMLAEDKFQDVADCH